ncbi:MAG: FAD-dependent oxidoreductase, partial [Patescibacteria group bacterium]
MKYLIIGAGIAGSTAAETIREQDKEGEITIISGEAELVYNR